MQGEAGWAFDCHAACVGDPDPRNLNRPASGPGAFGLHHGESVAHKVKQFRREPRKEKWIGAAVLPRIGEHLERLASSLAHAIATIQNILK